MIGEVHLSWAKRSLRIFESQAASYDQVPLISRPSWPRGWYE